MQLLKDIWRSILFELSLICQLLSEAETGWKGYSALLWYFIYEILFAYLHIKMCISVFFVCVPSKEAQVRIFRVAHHKVTNFISKMLVTSMMVIQRSPISGCLVSGQMWQWKWCQLCDGCSQILPLWNKRGEKKDAHFGGCAGGDNTWTVTAEGMSSFGWGLQLDVNASSYHLPSNKNAALRPEQHQVRQLF